MKKTIESRRERLITDRATEDYLDSLCPGNRAVLEDIRSRAEQDDIPIIRRGSEELLKTILAMHDPKSILEIGTAVGYSALVMAETLPQSDIVTLEIGDADYAKAQDNFAMYALKSGCEYHINAAGEPEGCQSGAEGPDQTEPGGCGCSRHEDPSNGKDGCNGCREILRIESLHMNADDYLPQAVKEGRRFDFIFLDAAKAQYIVWLPDILRLLSDGGVLFADNVLLDGTVAMSRYALDRRDRSTHRRMREFLYAITHEPRLTTAVVPSGDGVSVSVYHSNGRPRAQAHTGYGQTVVFCT